MDSERDPRWDDPDRPSQVDLEGAVDRQADAITDLRKRMSIVESQLSAMSTAPLAPVPKPEPAASQSK